MKLEACGKTDTGLQRSNNEDSFHIDLANGLFIVADGMGGHAAGEVASRLAIETVCTALAKRNAADLNLWLGKAVRAANAEIRQAAEINPAWHKMGTTLTILALSDNQARLAHIGDSRFYRLRNKELQQLSEDHSLVAEQLRMGIITAEDARRSNLGNLLTQAVGITTELDICKKTIPLAARDRLLLCSDGLTTMLKDAAIARCLSQGTPAQACADLIEKALAAGGLDNVTVVVVDIIELDESTTSAPGN